MSITVFTPGDLGAFLRSRRKKLDYTQEKLAGLCGTGVRFISDLENGKETVQPGRALMVASSLGIDVSARERSGQL